MEPTVPPPGYRPTVSTFLPTGPPSDVLEADYDSDHDRGALATVIEDLLANRITKDPLADVHLLFSELAE